MKRRRIDAEVWPRRFGGSEWTRTDGEVIWYCILYEWDRISYVRYYRTGDEAQSACDEWVNGKVIPRDSTTHAGTER